MMKIKLFFFSLLLWFGNNLLAQKQRQFTFTAGVARSMLNDELWGYQTYKGWNTNYDLTYNWSNEKHQNQFNLSFAQGNITISNSVRQSTLDVHFLLDYHHLWEIKTFNKTKIQWSTGTGLANFLDLRIHDQFSSNNLASYNLGLGLQWQNLFRRTISTKNSQLIELSLLVENTLLSALLTPDYASFSPERNLDINGLNDLSFSEVVKSMKIITLPKFWRANFHTNIDFVGKRKLGWRLRYIWSIVHANRRLTFTGARHQFLGGFFIRF